MGWKQKECDSAQQWPGLKDAAGERAVSEERLPERSVNAGSCDLKRIKTVRSEPFAVGCRSDISMPQAQAPMPLHSRTDAPSTRTVLLLALFPARRKGSLYFSAQLRLPFPSPFSKYVAGRSPPRSFPSLTGTGCRRPVALFSSRLKSRLG